jgi:glucose-6-phosphate isomerase
MKASKMQKTTSNQISDSKVWHEIEQHQKRLENVQMRELFQKEPDRFKKFSLHFQGDGMLLDFSKNIFDEDAFKSLLKLIEEANVRQWREKMFNGEKINNTENRAVLHIALRNR